MSDGPLKTALVTGSTRAIGKAIVIELARAGWHVIINSRRPSGESNDILALIRSEGGRADYLSCDVRDESEVNKLFIQIHKRFGAINLLVNNVGLGIKDDWRELPKAGWMAAFENNLIPAVICSGHGARSMQTNGAGQIINVASVRGLEHGGHPHMVAYSCAKAALINFTKTVAKTLGPNIRMNAVAPGAVFGFSDDGKVPYDHKLHGNGIDVLDVARGVHFLAESTGITGEVLVIDGGFNLK